jgi:hypothetical protein
MLWVFDSKVSDTQGAHPEMGDGRMTTEGRATDTGRRVLGSNPSASTVFRTLKERLFQSPGVSPGTVLSFKFG